MHNDRIPGSHHAFVASACPLCGQPVAPEIHPLLTHLETAIAHRLQKQHPGWRAEAGACPECVFQAAEARRLRRSQTSLQDDLLFPYPVYAQDEARLLPIHQLLEADPGYTGLGVTLAFLDSGFYPHPDLTQPENRILCYVDATQTRPVEKERFSQPHIASWHGLMTSCVAAGNGEMSDRLYRGLASRASLVLVKTGRTGGQNHNGRGSRYIIREADIQRALAWVLANQKRFNIRVVNISLGGDHPANGKLNKLDRMVEEAVEQGMVVVTAAGNRGTEGLVPPASAPSAITVGGLDARNTLDRSLWRLYSSNYGQSVYGKPKPELVAPARWLAAPMLPRTRVHNEGLFLWGLDRSVERLLQATGRAPRPGESDSPQQLETVRRKIRRRMIEQKYIHPHYQHVDGTSMAAPLVSAVAALMLEVNPALAPAQVKQILVNTATPLDDLPAEKRGAGLVNAGRAVAAARRLLRGVLDTLPFSPYVAADQITFIYFDPLNSAARVALIGSFNGWNPHGYALSSSSPGLWQISIPLLPPGSYRYKFLVGENWVHDNENPKRAEDGYGGFSSILEV